MENIAISFPKYINIYIQYPHIQLLPSNLSEIDYSFIETKKLASGKARYFNHKKQHSLIKTLNFLKKKKKRRKIKIIVFNIKKCGNISLL